MTSATQRRLHVSAPNDGSRTLTLHDSQPRSGDEASSSSAGPSSRERNATVGVLKLRGVQRRTRQRVVWDADVVDNEGCGRKKSKICCIYHKPRPFDESSSESASASDSESDEGGPGGDDRVRPMRRHRHASHGHGCPHHAVRREGQGGTLHELREPNSDSDANAYERTPQWRS